MRVTFSEDDDKKELIPHNCVCDFEVVEAEEGVSKKGNEMIKLKLKVYAPDGSGHYLFDYLVSGAKSRYKVKQFCKAVGILVQDGVENEISDQDCVGKAGKLVVVQEDSDTYGTQNKVAEYVALSGTTKLVQSATEVEEQIPF